MMFLSSGSAFVCIWAFQRFSVMPIFIYLFICCFFSVIADLAEKECPTNMCCCAMSVNTMRCQAKKKFNDHQTVFCGACVCVLCWRRAFIFHPFVDGNLRHLAVSMNLHQVTDAKIRSISNVAQLLTNRNILHPHHFW